MPLFRVRLPSDRTTARKVMDLHLAGRVHRESADAARAEVWRHGRTPAGDPVFVGVTNGEPVQLLYDVAVHLDSGGR
ncbi:hypothetical protein Aph02nite_27990 [Actinoplanes philippinensis]|uniref:Uncharacterized protein n=1 Tax=Actinoplanes philippinensis TaxID=35752 RepID=A0A1I2GFC6_9ACTN|nr:hypothetical protein [Actinoplanes philippinensis]GIE76849.1 hypothetical protein Aph02nite_27990 [Actinoplanes philippinensis]SFF15446.1 hypothetical protein SAMN05421541_106454 [Actinoplanes philippinensis]